MLLLINTGGFAFESTARMCWESKVPSYIRNAGSPFVTGTFIGKTAEDEAMSVSCVRLSVSAARLMPVLGKYIRRKRFLWSRTKGSQEKGVPGDSMVTEKEGGWGTHSRRVMSQVMHNYRIV